MQLFTKKSNQYLFRDRFCDSDLESINITVGFKQFFNSCRNATAKRQRLEIDKCFSKGNFGQN